MSATTSYTSIPAGTWKVDPTHSNVGFEVDYVAGVFRGDFEPFDATLEASESGELSLRGSAEVGAIRVRSPQLAGHLQSPDFFDASRTPLLEFTSDRIEVDGDRIRVSGKLTIRGVERPVRLFGSISGPTQHFMGHTMVAMELSAMIDRTDFGLTWNQRLPNGGMALADDVRINATLYFSEG
ncbi:MAG TPA: YceI family protein [Solirubrobacteraceae bacterium]|jgi:polyisoprenoid-binding protein YceI